MRLQIKGLNYYQTLELITKMLLSNTNFALPVLPFVLQ